MLDATGTREPYGSLVRHEPVQSRSRERLTRVLDATAELLEEVGANEITIRSIADRAGVAVGSIYRFFPDKESIVGSLALRYLDGMVDVLDRFADREDFDTWEGLLDATVDAYVDYFRTHPGFRELWFNNHLPPELIEPNRTLNYTLARHFQQLADPLAGFEPPDEPDLDFLITVEIGDRMLDLAFRRDRDGDPIVIATAKTIMVGHLSRHMESRRAGDRPLPQNG